jgi:large subunit ribosomal protein L22
MMQATARLKYLMMSPRKVRRVVSLVKGKSVDEALTILKFTNKAAAIPLAKTIQAATANALSVEGTSRIKAEDLSIERIQVDEGPRAKRIRFRAMGRVYRYKKRFAHLTVIVKGEPSEEVPTKRRGKKAAADKAKPEKAAKTTAKKGKTAKPAAKKKAVKKTAAKKPTAKKATEKKPATKKTTAKKAAPKTTAAKKKTSTKAAPKKKSAKSDAGKKGEK